MRNEIRAVCLGILACYLMVSAVQAFYWLTADHCHTCKFETGSTITVHAKER